MKMLIALLSLLSGCLCHAAEYQLGREAITRQADYDTNRQRSRTDKDAFTNAALWYTFSRNNGTNAYDLSPQNYNATLPGSPTWMSTNGGGAFIFDSTEGKYVNAGTTIEVGGADFSVVAWIYLSTITGDWEGSIATKWDSEGGNANGFRFLFTGNSDNAGRLRILGDVSSGNGYSTTKITSNQWNHVVMVYHATPKVVDFYINGAPSGVSVGTNIVISATSYVLIFRRTLSRATSANPWGLWTGSLSELLVPKIALTATQVTNLYNVGKGSHGL